MTNVFSVYTPFLQDPLVSKRIRTRIFDWLLTDLLQPFAGRKLVDLGAGPCIFSKKGRDAGFDVTAVDARVERKPDDSELGPIKFVQSDITEFPLYGYDIVVNLGLLYHLDLEAQKRLLQAMTSSTISILETQVHDPYNLGECYYERLGEIQRVEHYEGVYFKEASNPMASWTNAESFWHTEESLIRMISDAGFSTVKKIFPRYISKYGVRQYFVLS